jgi:hypothetical protein
MPCKRLIAGCKTHHPVAAFVSRRDVAARCRSSSRSGSNGSLGFRLLAKGGIANLRPCGVLKADVAHFALRLRRQVADFYFAVGSL